MPAAPLLPATLDLPTPGGQVCFWSPEDLTGDDHRRAMGSIEGDPDDPHLSMAMDLMYAIACMLIKSWTIPYTPKGTDYPPGEVPIPTVEDNSILGKLRLSDYTAIITTVAPAMKLLNMSKGTPDQAPEPGSPTVPSGG